MVYEQNQRELAEHGYTIVRNFLSPEECQTLTRSFISSSLGLVFGGTNVDIHDERNLLLFTDLALRKERLHNPNMVWRNGNSRQPLLSKSCGMIDIHYNPEQMRIVNFNPKLYDLMSALYQKRELAHSFGPERFSIKPQGSTDMHKHIDANPFYPEVNHRAVDYLAQPEAEKGDQPKRMGLGPARLVPERIQTSITLSIDKNVKVEHSGTLFLIPYFHLYWQFVGELFHPTKGLVPYPDDKSRFFVLPTDWNKKYLPLLRQYATEYTEFFHRNGTVSTAKTLQFFSRLKADGIMVPVQMKPLEWVGMNVSPGDIVCWDQYLPHYTAKNKSITPRIVCYYNVFPVERDWFGTPEQKWCAQMFLEGKFFYGMDANKYPTTIRNIEEYNDLSRTNRLQDAIAPAMENTFTRRLAGLESWY